MPHIDEGTLHALLDGALAGDHAADARAHLQLCENCRSRLDEAERIRDQADAILGGAVPIAAVPPDFEELVARARASGAAAGTPARGPVRSLAPLVAPRTLAWAASLVLALAGGWWAHELALGPVVRGPAARQTLKATSPAASAANGAAPVIASASAAPAEVAAAPPPAAIEPLRRERAEVAPAAGPVQTAPPRVAVIEGVGERVSAPVGVRRLDAAAQAGRATAGLPYAAPPAARSDADVSQAEAARKEAARPAQAGENVAVQQAPLTARAETRPAPGAAPPPAAPAAKGAAPPRAPAGQPEGVSALSRAATQPTSPGAVYPSPAEARDLLARSFEFAPTYTPYTVAPELLNRRDAERALVREYPTEARDSGRGGVARLWLLVDTIGVVRSGLVKVSSGDRRIDLAALRVGRVLRFSPALNGDQHVPIWVEVPIVFRADGVEVAPADSARRRR